ncbi:NAD-dependent epimerase/dehydratase family protein (plasmid) [Embleya sp. NBC_00888]|uniref:NAD-dependent epimerase/dehydratase family protein n=1 Tax=Embleya sp. NBC_00888 TaxID=2975960 RepID=UPI002F918392|nr:NAD-dependent epimerase/dehydratase family protein [Embleya sp. NBC_00888]
MDTRLTTLDGAKILITGGARLIGTRLRDLLSRAGATTTLRDDLSAYDRVTLPLLGVDPHDPRLTIGSICDEPLVRDLVSRADHVVHAAVTGCAQDPPPRSPRTSPAPTSSCERVDAAADDPPVRRPGAAEGGGAGCSTRSPPAGTPAAARPSAAS